MEPRRPFFFRLSSAKPPTSAIDGLLASSPATRAWDAAGQWAVGLAEGVVAALLAAGGVDAAAAGAVEILDWLDGERVGAPLLRGDRESLDDSCGNR